MAALVLADFQLRNNNSKIWNEKACITLANFNRNVFWGVIWFCYDTI
jgi:hypothetical protein